MRIPEILVEMDHTYEKGATLLMKITIEQQIVVLLYKRLCIIAM